MKVVVLGVSDGEVKRPSSATRNGIIGARSIGDAILSATVHGLNIDPPPRIWHRQRFPSCIAVDIL